MLYKVFHAVECLCICMIVWEKSNITRRKPHIMTCWNHIIISTATLTTDSHISVSSNRKRLIQSPPEQPLTSFSMLEVSVESEKHLGTYLLLIHILCYPDPGDDATYHGHYHIQAISLHIHAIRTLRIAEGQSILTPPPPPWQYTQGPPQMPFVHVQTVLPAHAPPQAGGQGPPAPQPQ